MIEKTEAEIAIVAIDTAHALRVEVERLKAVNAELLAELQNIADANPMNWDALYNDTASFRQWAQNRARFSIKKATA